MKLDNLTYWKTSGTPDVFTESKGGYQWRVISHGQPYDAGFFQRVEFARPVKRIALSVVAGLHTDGGLMLRVGIDPTGGTNPSGASVKWGGWFGPSNGWAGEDRTLTHSDDMLTNAATVFLRSATGGWPVRSNVSRWCDAQLDVEYLDTTPEPEPPTPPKPPDPPEPDPDTPESIRVLQQAMTLSSQLLEQAGKMTVAIGQVLALFDQKPEV